MRDEPKIEPLRPGQPSGAAPAGDGAVATVYASDVDAGLVWSKYAAIIISLLTLALLGAGSWASYHATQRNDQYQLIQLGQCVKGGGKMYLDCWENKPPGIAWINALGLLAARGDPIAPWLMPAAIETLVLVLVWRCLGRVLGGRTAAKTALITALVYALRIYDTPSINPDFYASMFELAAVAVFVCATVPRLTGFLEKQDPVAVEAERTAVVGFHPLLGLVAGLLWAGATSIKQVGCVGLVVFSACVVATAILYPRDFGAVLKTTAMSWLGFVVGFAAVAGVLWRQGVLQEAWHAIFSFNAGFADWQAVRAAFANRAQIYHELAPAALPLWLGLVGLIMTFWYRRFRGFPIPMVIGLVLWWVAAVVLAAMGPSKSMRYWQAMFPPMVALAAVGLYYIQRAQDHLRQLERLTVFIVGLSAAVLLARPAIAQLRYGLANSYASMEEHPTEREQLTEVAARVREVTEPGDRIYVLDYASGIYVYADRRPAARFNYPRNAEQFQEILKSIDEAKLILLPVHPSAHFSTWDDIAWREKVKQLLDTHEMVDQVGGYMMLQRRSSS